MPTNHTSGRALVALLCLALAGPAVAAPRIAIGPVGGDRSGGLHRQLSEALCGGACAPWSSVSTKGRPDPAKARARRVAAIVTAAKVRGHLLVSVFTRARSPARSWSLPLNRAGRLPSDELEELRGDLGAMLGGELGAPAPPPQAPPPAAIPPPAPPPAAIPAPPPAPPAAAPAAPLAAEPRPIAPPPVARPVPPPPAGRPPAQAVARPPRAPPARPPVVAGELGLYVTSRSLDYSGTGTGSGTLRAFDVPTIVSPRIRLELFPAAYLGPVLGGLGAFGDYSTSVGLKTEVQGTGDKRGTTFSSLEAGLLWRVPLGGVVLVPAASYRRTQVTVGPSIGGLPDARLTGWKGSLGAEIPLVGPVGALAGAGYVVWTAKRDLIGPSFFPGGSAQAFEGEVGLSVRVWSPLSLRGLFEYRSTRYSLDPDPSGTYVASGARDTCVGGRVMLRAEY